MNHRGSTFTDGQGTTYRPCTERKVVRDHLVLDMILPIPGLHAEQSKIRLVVIQLSIMERRTKHDTWELHDRRYVCGTPCQYSIMGCDAPPKPFDGFDCHGATNMYQAANWYLTQLTGAVIAQLRTPEAFAAVCISRPSSQQARLTKHA